MQCSVFIAASLDGYIARPDGGLDWLRKVDREGEDYGYAQFADTVDVLVTGRGAYDVVRDFEVWPYPGKRVIVLTHRPAESLHGEAFYSGSIEDLARTLAGEGVRRVYVDGGVVIRQFLAAGLIDDLTIAIIPVVLGDGIRLFDGGQPECGLVLDGAETFPSGLVQLRYRTAR